MAIEKDLVSMDEFVDNLLKQLNAGKTTSEKVLDDLDFYNKFTTLDLNINQLIGEKQVLFGFEVMKTDGKMIFMTKCKDGKQHMFSYDTSSNKFIGKKRIHDVTNIGLIYKQ